MKKLMFLVLALTVMTCYANTGVFAATSDRTDTVTATGSIAAVTSLSAAPVSIAYGTTTADAFPTTPTDKKILITYGSNYNPWIMRVYTNNTRVPVYSTMSPTNPELRIGHYAKGGLISATAANGGVNVVPCKWVTKVGTNVTVPVVPNTASKYNFVKDIRDENDPDSTYAEDWATASAAGYANIAFGGPGSGFCVDPTVTTVGHENEGNPVTPATGVALYIAAAWLTSYDTPATPAGAGSYSTTFTIDLLHE